MRLLLVDDDIELAGMLKGFFQAQGVEIDQEADGNSGLARALTESHDLIILDVTLPGLDGLEVLRRLRETSRVPVLMLTGRASLKDRVRALDLGADDYLTKPFGTEELLARIHAIERRVYAPIAPRQKLLETEDLRLAPGTREAYYRGAPLELTAMECDILEQLMKSSGQVVSRDQLSLHLYKRPTTAYDRSVDTHVARIRRKLGAGRDLIMSVRGTGYQLRQAPRRPLGKLESA